MYEEPARFLSVIRLSSFPRRLEYGKFPWPKVIRVSYGHVVNAQPQGWYRDPYAIHEDRYFSAGQPTKLVRDGGRESHDALPDRSLPDGELVSAERPAEELTGALSNDAMPKRRTRRFLRTFLDLLGAWPW